MGNIILTFITEKVFGTLIKLIKHILSKQVKVDGISLKNQILYKRIIGNTKNSLLAYQTPEIDMIGNIDIFPQVQKIKNLWEKDQKGVLVTGGGGSGKTSLAIELARFYIDREKPAPAIYIDANDFSENQNPIEFLSEKFGIDGHFTQEFKNLSEDRPCVFIVDQLDDIIYEKKNAFDSLIAMMKDFSNTGNIVVIGVIRNVDAEEKDKIQELSFHRYSVTELSEQETKKYLDLLGIKNPCFYRNLWS